MFPVGSKSEGETSQSDVSKHEDFSVGPFSFLNRSVINRTQVLIYCHSNKKLLAHVKAFDHHFNMVLENVKEIWVDNSKRAKAKNKSMPVTKDRFISKMFLRGDSVILICANPVVKTAEK